MKSQPLHRQLSAAVFHTVAWLAAVKLTGVAKATQLIERPLILIWRDHFQTGSP